MKISVFRGFAPSGQFSYSFGEAAANAIAACGLNSAEDTVTSQCMDGVYLLTHAKGACLEILCVGWWKTSTNVQYMMPMPGSAWRSLIN